VIAATLAKGQFVRIDELNQPRIVQETSMAVEAPTAVSAEIIDYLAAGFRKVLSLIDEVLKIKLPPELTDGGPANCGEIQGRAMEANQ